jgi:micrococcal nuclease
MRSILGAVAAVVALSATGCGTPPSAGTTPPAPTTTTTTTVAPAPVESPVPAPPLTTTLAPPPPPPRTTTAKPAPVVYYANCSEARAAGAAPILRGQPGYRPALDRDNDGIACE